MRRRGYLLAYRTTSTVRDWPSRWMVRRMVSPTEWLRRTVSRSLVTETGWPSASRMISPGYTPASAAPRASSTV